MGRFVVVHPRLTLSMHR